MDTSPIDAAAAAAHQSALGVGSDERRMHVRAYNHWVSLLRGRAYPSIDDLNPTGIADFGAHSVLLDFTNGVGDPSITFLGRSLREECGLAPSVARIADVPARSLLSRLTDHYLQIIANRAPIGFEAEFVGTRGHVTLYRGILMPFSSDDVSIDFIYGVINWKEVLDAPAQAELTAELDAAVRGGASHTPADVPVWADGPGAGSSPGGGIPAGPDPAAEPVEAEPLPNVAPLAQHLRAARECAAAAMLADTRSRGALYRALGRAHDFALAAAADPGGFDAMLAENGIVAQARAPMTPVVKLVFGADYDKTRLTEFAAVLAAAKDAAVPAGGLAAFLDNHAGGVKGVVQAVRAARRPAGAPATGRRVPRGFAARPALAQLTLDLEAAPGAPVLLVARGSADGAVEIVGSVADPRLLARALAAMR